MKEIEKEIVVVENIIKLLNRSLVIYKKEKKTEYIKNTLTDIHLCKKELKRLLTEKQMKLEAEKEPG